MVLQFVKDKNLKLVPLNETSYKHNLLETRQWGIHSAAAVKNKEAEV